MKLSTENILAIAQDLQKGFTCYVHKKKRTHIIIPDVDFDTYYDTTGEDIRQSKAYKKVKKKPEKYLKIKQKYIAFKKYDLMEEFVENIESPKTRQIFLDILSKKKSFQNFEHYLNLYGFLQNWHNFKNEKYQLAVVDYLAEKMN